MSIADSDALFISVILIGVADNCVIAKNEYEENPCGNLIN